MIFGLTVSNIPIVNLKQEFKVHSDLLVDPDVQKQLLNVRQPIETAYLIWRRLPGVADPFGYKWWIATHIMSNQELEALGEQPK